MGWRSLGSRAGLGDRTRMGTGRYLGEGRKRRGTTCGSIILRLAQGQRSRRGTTWWRVDGTLETRSLRFAGLPLGRFALFVDRVGEESRKCIILGEDGEPDTHCNSWGNISRGMHNGRSSKQG